MGSEAEAGRIMGWPVQVAIVACRGSGGCEEGGLRIGVACRAGSLCAHCWLGEIGLAQSQNCDAKSV